MSELKKCPFCGGEPLSMGNLVYCSNRSTDKCVNSLVYTTQSWNTRPLESALEAENKRLTEALDKIAKKADENECNEFDDILNVAMDMVEIARTALEQK